MIQATGLYEITSQFSWSAKSQMPISILFLTKYTCPGGGRTGAWWMRAWVSTESLALNTKGRNLRANMCLHAARPLVLLFNLGGQGGHRGHLPLSFSAMWACVWLWHRHMVTVFPSRVLGNGAHLFNTSSWRLRKGAGSARPPIVDHTVGDPFPSSSTTRTAYQPSLPPLAPAQAVTASLPPQRPTLAPSDRRPCATATLYRSVNYNFGGGRRPGTTHRRGRRTRPPQVCSLLYCNNVYISL